MQQENERLERENKQLRQVTRTTGCRAHPVHPQPTAVTASCIYPQRPYRLLCLQKAGSLSRYAGDEELALEMLEEENRQLAEENALLKSKIIDAIEFHDSDHMGPYGKNILDLFKNDGRVMVQVCVRACVRARLRAHRA
jgi:hypothetical protein